MKSPLCSTCGARMKKNGKTKDGTQRFRCKVCGSSFTHRINSDAKALKEFVEWLLSRERQIDMSGSGRTFRRHTSKFWAFWPLPDVVDEIHRVIYVDGLYLSRNVVILIAASDDYVLSVSCSFRKLSCLGSPAFSYCSSRYGCYRWWS